MRCRHRPNIAETQNLLDHSIAVGIESQSLRPYLQHYRCQFPPYQLVSGASLNTRIVAINQNWNENTALKLSRLSTWPMYLSWHHGFMPWRRCSLQTDTRAAPSASIARTLDATLWRRNYRGGFYYHWSQMTTRSTWYLARMNKFSSEANHEQIHFSMIQGRTIDVAGKANTFILIKANTSLLRVSMLASMDKEGVINQPRSTKKHTVLADWVLRKCMLTQSI